MRRSRFLVIGLVLLGVGVLGLIGIGAGGILADRPGNSPVDRGEYIFRTGRDPSDGAISYTNGMMMRLACATCHGRDGHGRRTPMFISPDITFRNLTDPQGMLEPDGSRGPTYTEDQIRRAITQGIDAEGQPLAWPMPHWQMSDDDLNDLLAYLKTLP